MSVEGTAAQLAWLRDRYAPRIYLIDVLAYNLDTPAAEHWYFISEPLHDADEDVYRPVLVGDVVFGQRLSEKFLGGAVSSGGSFTLDNSEGDLDTLLTDTYCLCGRELIIYGIDPSDATWEDRNDYLELFHGWTESVERLSDNAIRFTFTQYGEKANRDLFVHVIATPAVRTPITLGRCLNVEPDLDDQTLLRYSIGGVDHTDIDAVYINAVSQTQGADHANQAALDAASVTAGTYQTCFVEGLFRLGSTPDGQVTADVQGPRSPTMLATAADIINLFAQPTVPGGSRGPYIVYDASSWSAFKTAAAQDLGFHRKDPINVLDAVSVVVQSVGGVWWYDNTGDIQLEVFTSPGTAVGTIEEDFDIVGDVNVTMLPTVWRYEINSKRNWTVQSGEGLPSSITQNRRAVLGMEYQSLVASSDSTIESSYPSARIIVEDSLIGSGSAALTEAARRLTVHKGPRNLYKIRVIGRPCAFGINETWTINHDRVAPSGKDLVVVSVTDHLIERFTDLELWG